MKGEYISIETLKMYQEIEKENKELQEEKDALLRTVEKYRKTCLKISDYIKQNCEIIRHKDYDEIGKVNGGHILYLLNGDINE